MHRCHHDHRRLAPVVVRATSRPRDRRGRAEHEVLGDRDLDPLFAATVEASEEAVLDSMFRATTTVGRLGRVAEALPIEELLELM
ncbi:MAG TPA: P1 family peptidase [Ilumatobacteraceae bacterium]|nr:P1 family peptidase [Ilumatobacteraceae bacterium]